MVRSLILYMGMLFLILVSCQKETSFEIGKPARGSLQGSSGDCLQKVVGGTYKASQALADSNYIDVTINVVQPGNYTVYTDTLNGYSFKGTGNAAATGTAVVRIKGSGTPLAAGVNNFTVFFDTTLCIVPVTVIANSSSSGGTAVFSLAGAPATCTGATPAGTYTQNTALTSANKVDIQVNVTTPGTWSMSSNTVTGFSFSGTGTFTSTGVQTITLIGTGTPTSAGLQTFSIAAGTSTCTFPVTVVSGTSVQAAFTLQGAPGACMLANVAGTYTVGTALTTSNKVDIQVNVTTAGQWAVSTNTVTGMSFNNIGTFAATGIQTITLLGTGTPSTAGVQTFTVTAGASTCTFTVTVAATATTSNDHFILTPNSWWSYDDNTSPGDTLKRTNIGTATFTGNPNTFNEFEEVDATGAAASYFYRKDAATNFYYEYSFVDDYSVITFDSNVEGEILFLKENLATNDTWTSAIWSGTDASDSLPKKLRYSFTCTNNNATVTLNGKTYNNVYKITMVSETAPAGSNNFTSEGLVWDYWYAKGIGMIYTKVTFGGSSIDFPIRNYQVF